MLTGIVLLSSGVWNEKTNNQFQITDIEILANSYEQSNSIHIDQIRHHLNGSDGEKLAVFDGNLTIENGKLIEPVTMIHARSIAENISFYNKKELFSGNIKVKTGKITELPPSVRIEGESLIHSAQLTTVAFTRSIFGKWGKYIVAIGIMLFAFSTAISWSYYGDRSVTFLFGARYVIYYRILFVIAFFFASFTDTTIIWNLSLLTVVFMAIPNLIGILLLRKEVRSTIRQYWVDFKNEHPEEKIPEKIR